MKKIDTCPYCGSKNVEFVGNECNPYPYHCYECDEWFNEQTKRREEIRKKISAILMNTNKSNPLDCEIVLESCPENYGLSTLEMPHIVKAFQEPSEGIIWFLERGSDEYKEFDDYLVAELEDILKGLEN